MHMSLKWISVALVLAAATPGLPVAAAALIDTRDTSPSAICLFDPTTRTPEPTAPVPPIAACQRGSDGATDLGALRG